MKRSVWIFPAALLSVAAFGFARSGPPTGPPPDPAKSGQSSQAGGWSALKPQTPDVALLAEVEKTESDAANSGLRREPELPDHVAIAKETSTPKPAEEFAIMLDDEPEDAARQSRILRHQMGGVARQVSLDPNDGIEM